MRNSQLKITMLVTLFMSLSFVNLRGEEVAINMQHINHGTHHEIPVPADKPDVYYDSDTQEIIVDGNGYATYYDVNIISVATGLSVIFDTVGGYYGTVDVSSLPSDDYEIVITSSNNNVFEGGFYKQ